MNTEVIWSEYQRSLRAFLSKQVSNPDDVDDLLQEVLIKTYNNLGSVQNSKKIKPWLFQVARNTTIDFYRQKGKETGIENESLWFEEPEEDVMQALSGCVIPFIKGLPEKEARLLTAIEIEGVPQIEYAKRNNIKYSTLKSQVTKSRKMLMTLFNNCCEFSVDKNGKPIDFAQKKSHCRNPC